MKVTVEYKGQNIVVGTLYAVDAGWKFIPHFMQRKPSRKFWPTPEAALKSYKIKDYKITGAAE